MTKKAFNKSRSSTSLMKNLRKFWILKKWGRLCRCKGPISLDRD